MLNSAILNQFVKIYGSLKLICESLSQKCEITDVLVLLVDKANTIDVENTFNSVAK